MKMNMKIVETNTFLHSKTKFLSLFPISYTKVSVIYVQKKSLLSLWVFVSGNKVNVRFSTGEIGGINDSLAMFSLKKKQKKVGIFFC